jgi:hypothetical protein
MTTFQSDRYFERLDRMYGDSPYHKIGALQERLRILEARFPEVKNFMKSREDFAENQ